MRLSRDVSSNFSFANAHTTIAHIYSRLTASDRRRSPIASRWLSLDRRLIPVHWRSSPMAPRLLLLLLLRPSTAAAATEWPAPRTWTAHGVRRLQPPSAGISDDRRRRSHSAAPSATHADAKNRWSSRGVRWAPSAQSVGDVPCRADRTGPHPPPMHCWTTAMHANWPCAGCCCCRSRPEWADGESVAGWRRCADRMRARVRAGIRWPAAGRWERSWKKSAWLECVRVRISSTLSGHTLQT